MNVLPRTFLRFRHTDMVLLLLRLLARIHSARSLFFSVMPEPRFPIERSYLHSRRLVHRIHLTRHKRMVSKFHHRQDISLFSLPLLVLLRLVPKAGDQALRSGPIIFRLIPVKWPTVASSFYPHILLQRRT